VSLWSPNVIELWEAVITFALFPILVACSYGVDKGMCGLKLFKRGKSKRQMELGAFGPGESKYLSAFDKKWTVLLNIKLQNLPRLLASLRSSLILIMD